MMFDFGPYQFDQHAFRLLKNGLEVEIEPQVLNTLSLLIQNRERVVIKDELLEEIWHGRPVSDHVITRTIYELRKILDNKSDKTSHIRTVRGKGYQFIAEVHESVPITADIKQVVSTLNQPRESRSMFLKAKVILILMLGVGLLVMAWVFLSTNTADILSSQSNQNIYPIVAVLPIEVESGNEELSILVESLIAYLTNQLVTNLNIKVIHPDSLVNMSTQLDDIWAIQQATHSNFIIQGFIEPVSEQRVKLHLNLYKNDNNGDLTPFSLGAFELPYPKNAKELNDLYKQRKVTVRSIVEIIRPGMVVKDNGDTETDDPEAYRLVIAAHHMARTDNCEDLQRAEQLLLKAVARDDEFAYAYYQLFANYFKRVWVCGDSIAYHQKALEMAEIVQRLAPNSYSAMTLGINTIMVESNQVEKAYELFKDADWNNPLLLNHKNYGLRYAGFLNLASQNINRILQVDPFFFSKKPINQAPSTLLYQNRFKEHLALLALPGNSYHDYYRGLNLLLSNHTLEATEVLQGVVEKKSTDLFDRLSQALLFVIEQDYPKAIKIVDEITQQRKEKSHSDGEMTYKLAQIYSLANSSDLALKNLQTSVDQGFFPMNYFLNDPALKLIQDTEQFAAIVKQATERHEAFAKKFNLRSEAKFALKKR